mgnify:CR=1 FL=1
MPYTTNDARKTLLGYLRLNENQVQYIDDTDKRGFIYTLKNGEKCVIFLYPISRKSDNSKNFFDTRDSGPFERGKAWEFANFNHLKYFCLAVHDQVDKYKDYIFSLECDEKRVAEVAGTINGRRADSGTQVVIPNDWEPDKKFERKITRLGFYVSAIHKDFINQYLEEFDNRPYMNVTGGNNEDSLPSVTADSIKFPLIVDSTSDRNQIKQSLIQKLNSIEASESDDGFNMLSQLVLFGIQNGKIITENNITANELASGSDIYDNYHQHIRFGIQIYNHAKENPLSEQSSTQNNFDINKEPTDFLNPEQIIYYGVPGSGKSHKISERLEKEYQITDEDLYVERTVFHPEYTNSDFIGQIIPRLIQGKTDFQFKPGPFTSILKKALYDSAHRYVLIIEEINRGNAAAIFGEIFQLLDRIKNGVTSTEQQGSSYHNHYGKGWSDYFVMNTEINNYIRDSQDSYDGKALDFNGIHFSGNTGIRLPPNLSILATMNTSDQNVFTLDNAFQRRWDMKIVENVFGSTPEENNQKGAFVDTAKTVTWEKFQSAINIKIGKMSQDAGLSSMEDKRLGGWFVTAEKQADGSYTIPKEVFAEKVLKYLWDDAFKFSREKVFVGYNTLEELTKDFKETKGLAVFKDLFPEENA